LTYVNVEYFIWAIVGLLINGGMVMKLPITQRGWKIQGRVNLFIGKHSSGMVKVADGFMKLMDKINSEPCPTCGGNCHVIDNGLKCPSCGGSPL
jgi:hypothetical protein